MFARTVRLRLALVALGLVAAVSGTTAQGPPAPPPGLDAAVERVMKAFDVPGIGLAIVKDGAVVAARGYGARKLGEGGLVDARTLFGIASNTKVFTAVALGLLVEEGKVGWDAPVIQYVPWFQMWDPYVTRELTVRDLLVHRSGLGLGAGDLLWWPPTTYDRKEIVRRIRRIRPATSFRNTYAYDNVLYLVAGEVIEAVSGQRWEQFVSERILKRVGMNDSSILRQGSASGVNTAATHARVDGRLQVVEPFASEIVNPAGGINASAADMAKWALVLLNEGRLADGTRLFSEKTARELMTLVTPRPIVDPPLELTVLKPNFRGYALGLEVHDYRGRKVVTHTGGLPGYVSKVTLLPELRLGVVVLTNQESGEAYSALTWSIVDHYLGAPTTDWVEAYEKSSARQRTTDADAVKSAASKRDATSRPSLPLERYAGTYRDDWYGDVTIEEVGGTLVMRFTKTPMLVGSLEHWQYDTFIVRWRDRGLRADAYVTFALQADGAIERATMKAVSPETDFSFDFHDLRLVPLPSQTSR